MEETSFLEAYIKGPMTANRDSIKDPKMRAGFAAAMDLMLRTNARYKELRVKRDAEQDAKLKKTKEEFNSTLGDAADTMWGGFSDLLRDIRTDQN